MSQEEWERLSPSSRDKILHLIEARFEMISSPLLPPEILRQYGETVPGLDKKLVEWTEQESAHRRAMEQKSFEATRRFQFRGQTFSIVVALFGLAAAGVVGVYSAMHGSGAGAFAASVLAIASVGGPVAARILAGRLNNNASQSDK